MATDAEIVELVEKYLDTEGDTEWQQLLDAMHNRQSFQLLEVKHSTEWGLIISLLLGAIFWALIANTVTLWLT